MLATLAALTCFLPAQIQDDLPSLGTNLAGVTDYTTQWPFVDAFKVSRSWVSQKVGAEWGQGEPLDIDESGNVKALKPGQFAETVIFSNGKCPKGAYSLTWEGDGDFDAHNGSKLTVKGKNSATLELNGDAGIFLMLKRVDPKNPPHNIRLVIPGYEETAAEEPFHPIFLQRMSLYRCLRFMDWGRVNNSQARTWASRALPTDATYATEKGVPYETMIDLANRKSTLLWLCVPHLADDDYVRNLAKLVKERLRPDLRVVVEYSNECWNQSFAQAKWCVEQGKKLNLSDDASEAGLRFYSQRSVEVFALFENVFGGRSRLVRVLSAQAANPKTAEEVLGWKSAHQHADALAIAPYFGYALGTSSNAAKTKSGTLDDVFAALKSEVEGPLRTSLFSYAGLAQRNRLRLVSYEGGQHLVAQPPNQDDAALNGLFDEANRDQRMMGIYAAHLKSWRASGGSLFMHFTDCAPYSKYGRWGTIEFQNQDPQTSYKNQALIQYALFPDR